MPGDSRSISATLIGGCLALFAALVLGWFSGPVAVGVGLLLLFAAVAVAAGDWMARRPSAALVRSGRRTALAAAFAGAMGIAILVGLLTRTRWLWLAGGISFTLVPFLLLALGFVTPTSRKGSSGGPPS